MRGGLTAAALALDPLQAVVDARLRARLDRTSAAPVALGLSGGGDSLALLHLAADWCARARRPLLALTVDHGLQPQGPAWTARAGRMAAEAGAAWRPLAWTGPKPSAGVPAAARSARHALLAAAARGAGARVLLLAHTADDHAETEALRGGPAPGIGRLREWAPSPAWPEGRGVFLLRPLLDAGRGELRAWLCVRGLGWIEDPANADPRFARARVRAVSPPRAPPAPDPPPGFGEAHADGTVQLSRARTALADAAARRSLTAALACAAGTNHAPRRAALDRLLEQCSGTAAWTATLGGARVLADTSALVVGREPGRTPAADLPLEPGSPTIWDGRFELRTTEAGWCVGAAAGRLSRLTAPDRTRLAALPPVLRAAAPVLVCADVVRLPRGDEVRALAPARFDAAVGEVRREGRSEADAACAGTVLI